ncbi:ricin-type beta-trefoil lectin domain protein [Streptomyces sp. NPDC094448]|uniref:ricin-type beta-trefoil lectin domain protein n=1 Tax=Streptomyces sp. NPDC094448 TaxID=3366063 RepID=UPI00381AB5DC
MALTVGMLPGANAVPPPTPRSGVDLPEVPDQVPVPGEDGGAFADLTTGAVPIVDDYEAEKTAAPPAAAASQPVAALAPGQTVPVGTTPLEVGAPPAATPAEAAALQGNWQVSIADQTTLADRNIEGVVFTVTPPATATGKAVVGLDYTRFAELYGANWADRLQLTLFPSCFLTTPDIEPCSEPVEVETENTVTPAATDAPGDGKLDGTRRIKTTLDVASLTDPATPPAAARSAAEADRASSRRASGGAVHAVYRAPAEAQGEAPFARPASTRSAFAQQAAAAGAGVLLATAEGGGEKGDFSATPLPGAGEWTAGTSSGGFSYNYKLHAPSVPGGPSPNLAFGYSSQAVDGSTSVTNNQPSWIGDGWDYNPGSITRTYRSCREDTDGGNNTRRKTTDLCWGSYNAILTLGGTTTELVLDDADKLNPHTAEWETANGDGSRVQLLKDPEIAKDGVAPSGDDDGEYWKVTTRDGTQYFFGRHKLPGWTAGKETTGAAFVTPVAGNQPDEPCYNATFANSFCSQAWRWNLDYVVDTKGNAMSLWWNQENNYYARNLKFKQPVKYDRGGWLKRIDYGQHKDRVFTQGPIARVTFDEAERCFREEELTCDPANFTSGDFDKSRIWYDTPADLYCSGAAGKECFVPLPTFWSRKRLDSVTTWAQRTPGSTALSKVDTWDLDQSLPAEKTDEGTALWLDKITRYGHGTDGKTAKTNPVEFVANTSPMPNRVKGDNDSSPMYDRLRVSKIINEYGGETHIAYRQPTGVCQTGERPGVNFPAPEANTGLCYPVFWDPDPLNNMKKKAWFNKYVVDRVTELSGILGTPPVATDYQYLGGGAWALNQAEFSKKKARTYDQWRGFETVRTISGADSPDAYQGSERSQTEARFFRGMDGEKLPNGQTRSVVMKDSKGQDIARDSFPYQGRIAEALTYTEAGGTVVTREVDTPRHKVLATRVRGTGLPDLHAYRVLEESSTTITASSGTRTDTSPHTDEDPRTERITRTTTEYENTYDLPVQVEFHGDTGRPGDETCSRLSYVHSTGAHLIGLSKEAKTTTGLCSATGASVKTVSGSRVTYDGVAFGGVPVDGLVTSAWQPTPDGGGWETTPSSKLTYDSYGRTTATTDATGSTETTTYTPSDGQVHIVTTENALGHKSISEVDPGRGSALKETDTNTRTTRFEYDALGRTVKAYAPSQTGSEASALFEYHTPPGKPPFVVSRALTEEGGYAESVVFYDGLGRERQKQEPAVGKGRLVTDILYSANGSIRRTNNGYYATGEPQRQMYEPEDASDTKIPNATLYKYDGLGRILAETPHEAGVTRPEKANRNEFGLDYSISIPPAGAAAQREWSDALGRTVRMDTFTDHARTAWRSTAYTFDSRGDMTAAKDPKGNTWSWKFDALGRQTEATDPDAGTSLTEYDVAGRPIRARDGRQNWVQTKYDALSRPTEVLLENGTGPATPVQKTEYDQIPGAVGLPSRSTRYTDNKPYTEEVTGYTSDYQPTGTKLTLPADIASRHGLQQTYSYGYEYSDRTGRMDAVSLPGVGALTPEKVVTRYNEDGLPISTSGKEWYTSGTVYSPYGQVMRTVSGENPHRVWNTNFYNESTGALERSVVDRQSISDTTTVTGHRVNDRQYGYDLSGNITSVRDAFGNGTTEQQCFSYDILGQLTEAWTAPGTCTAPGKQSAAPEYPDGTKNVSAANDGYWQSYRYDELGQRDSLVKHDPGLDGTKDVTTRYTYGKPGGGQPHTLTKLQTTSRTAGGAEITKEATRTYDAGGNTLTRADGAGSEQAIAWTWDGKAEKVTGFGENGSGAWTSTAGRCLDLAGGRTAPNTALQTYSCNETKAQRFRIDPASKTTPDTGTLKVLGKCAVPQNNGIADGTPVVIADCTGTAGQQWKTVAAGKKLQHVDSGKCLTVPGTGAPIGTDLQLAACGTAAQENQSWTPADETTYIYGPGGDRLMSVSSGTTSLYLGEAKVTTSGGIESSVERYYAQPGAPTVMRYVSAGNSELSAQITDHNGTAVASVELAPGNAVKFSKKDPFGADRSEHHEWRSQRDYVGGDDDASTGLVHLGAREYEPATGRFLSPDPLIDIADPVQMNGYVYGDNNPVTFADPSGLISVAQGGGSGGYDGDQYGGPSWSEYQEAQRIMGTSLMDIILSSGWGVLKEFLGWNDAVACATRGDLWSCANLALSAVGGLFGVAAKFKKIVSAVKAMISAVSAWKKAQERARKIIEAAKKAMEAAKKAKEAKARAKKAAQLEKQRAREAAVRAAKKDAQKTGNAVQKAKKVEAKKAEKPVRSPVQLAKAPPKRSGGGKGGSDDGNGGTCPNPGNSFTPGTLVLMADGSTKPIEEVRTGDRVVATDPETGETAVERVTAEITGRGEKNLVDIVIDTDGRKGSATAEITATDGHPFWVPELREWIDATDLSAGDWLRTGAGTLVQIAAVERWTAQSTVHNLTVEDLHTYYVVAGAAPVLVHNCGYKWAPPDAPTDVLDSEEAWNPSQGIPVIGRLPDTSVGGSWQGHKKLEVNGKWSMAKNDAWIQTIIDQKGSVYVGSPTMGTYWNVKRQEPTVFAREIQQLRQAGYRWEGDYLVPSRA